MKLIFENCSLYHVFSLYKLRSTIRKKFLFFLISLLFYPTNMLI